MKVLRDSHDSFSVTSMDEIARFNKIMLNFPKIEAAFLSIRRVFNEFDTDKNGTMSHEELQAAMKRLTQGNTPA